jgi:hypothetical protein
MQGSISLGTGLVQLLLNKHKDMNGVGIEASTLEGDCVMPTREDSLNSDSRT